MCLGRVCKGTANKIFLKMEQNLQTIGIVFHFADTP